MTHTNQRRSSSYTGDVKGGSETILLVEDEEMLLTLMKNILERNGYKVLAAGDGLRAVNVYKKFKDEIALVLADLGLPKLDGWRALEEIQSINSNVKVIVTSGYLDSDARSKVLKAGAKEFVQKPCLPNEIMRLIREVIDRGTVEKQNKQ